MQTKNKIFEKSLMNKKADEKLLSIWWLFILGMIGIGVVTGVVLSYSVKVDTRATESEILALKILDCVINQGEIIDEAMQDDFKDKIFEKCFLDRKIFDEAGVLHFNLSFYQGDKAEKSFVGGPSDLHTQCLIKEKSEAKYYSECVTKKMIAKYDDKSFFVVVIAASNQIGKRL